MAAIRADAVNFPLFLHVAGAMVLVGTLLFIVLSRRLAARGDGGVSPGIDRLTLRTVLVGVLPAYVLMRVGAQWTEAEQDLPDAVADSTWITIGYITADLGMLLLLVSIVLAIVGLRRIKSPEGGGAGAARAVGIMSALLIVVYIVTVWAMTAKPG